MTNLSSTNSRRLLSEPLDLLKPGSPAVAARRRFCRQCPIWLCPQVRPEPATSPVAASSWVPHRALTAPSRVREPVRPLEERPRSQTTPERGRRPARSSGRGTLAPSTRRQGRSPSISVLRFQTRCETRRGSTSSRSSVTRGENRDLGREDAAETLRIGSKGRALGISLRQEGRARIGEGRTNTSRPKICQDRRWCVNLCPASRERSKPCISRLLYLRASRILRSLIGAFLFDGKELKSFGASQLGPPTPQVKDTR